MVLVVVALIIAGGRRLRHLLFLAADAVVLRLYDRPGSRGHRGLRARAMSAAAATAYW
jgi:hypothetical protein